jgi:hypothetical protein
MRILLAACIVATFALALFTTPKAETWCIRDRAGVTSEICAFSSAHDCIHAALVGPAGGIVCAQQIRRSEGKERHVAFRSDNFRPSFSHAPKRKRSKKAQH